MTRDPGFTRHDPTRVHRERRRGLATAGAALAFTAVLGGLAGCQSSPLAIFKKSPPPAPPPPPPAKLSGSLVAAKELNPSISKRPSPLRLVVYELRASAAFDKADFMALYNNDAAAIGPDLVAREEFVLQPGETLPYDKVVSGETRFLGVFAAFRDVERATWRAISPVPGGRPMTLAIKAEALAVSVSVAVKP